MAKVYVTLEIKVPDTYSQDTCDRMGVAIANHLITAPSIYSYGNSVLTLARFPGSELHDYSVSAIDGSS